MNGKYKALIKDTAIFAIGNLGSKAILFFLVPLYTNYLSTEEYGIADLVTTFVTLIFPFTGLSIEKAVIRFGLKTNEKKENVLKVSFIVLIISYLVTFLIMPIIGLYKPIADWIVYLYALVILSNTIEVERSYLKIKLMNKAYSIIGIVQTSILAITNIVLISFCHIGVRGYLISNVGALGASAAISFFVSDMYHGLKAGRFSIPLLKRMIQYSAPLVFSGISWWIMHSSDKVMIEWMIGASALGLYTAATKIPSFINVAISIFNQAWTISSIKETESSKDVRFYSNTFDYQCAVLFGFGIIIISIVKPAMSIYVGQDFRTSWVYTPFLIVAAVYYSVFAFCGTLYAALQKSVNDMWTSVIAALTNIVINYVMILRVGTWGAVIGTVSSFFLFSIIRIIDIRHCIQFKIDIFRFTMNTLMIFAIAFCATFNYYYVLISCACVILYIIVNFRFIKRICAVASQFAMLVSGSKIHRVKDESEH